jgi:NAD(P)H-dependent flavin oxidoreductase YrpB (nitropropane dioxygenase family)
MLRTPLCQQLGIAYPILSVGMGPVAGPELAAAVSNAGGGGVLGGLFLIPSDFVVGGKPV